MKSGKQNHAAICGWSEMFLTECPSPQNQQTFFHMQENLDYCNHVSQPSRIGQIYYVNSVQTELMFGIC